MKLELVDVSVNVGGTDILKNISLTVPEKSFVGIVGLNGSGKSSLLKSVYGINKYKGTIKLDGIDIKEISEKELAKKMAVLVQENGTDFDFKVRDIVMLGRLPYKKILEPDSLEDYKVVEESLGYVGMQEFGDRYFNSLSGGEKQRVLIARILAQKTDFLILDEPTNHLDIKNQYQFFEMIKNLDITVVSVLHDLNIAAKFCDYVYVLYEGKIYKYGEPKQVFDEHLLEEVFGMNVSINKQGQEGFCINFISSFR